MSVISYKDFVHSLLAAVTARKPFSFVRVGDGEGIIIGYPEFTSVSDFDKRMQKWTRLLKPLTVQEREIFAWRLRRAIASADIVCTPAERHMCMGDNWRNVRKYLRHYRLVQGAEACMDYVLTMHLQQAWDKVLRGLDKLHVISCRDLQQRLRARFDIKCVEQFALPPQVHPAYGKTIAPHPHYPTQFLRALQWIRAHAAGNVFLIGAGGFGKIYADNVRQNGGVAFDIGSLFDAWAGLPTRSYIRDDVRCWLL